MLITAPSTRGSPVDHRFSSGPTTVIAANAVCRCSLNVALTWAGPVANTASTAGRGLVIAHDSGNGDIETHLAACLALLETHSGDPLAALRILRCGHPPPGNPYRHTNATTARAGLIAARVDAPVAGNATSARRDPRQQPTRGLCRR